MLRTLLTYSEMRLSRFLTSAGYMELVIGIERKGREAWLGRKQLTSYVFLLQISNCDNAHCCRYTDTKYLQL